MNYKSKRVQTAENLGYTPPKMQLYQQQSECIGLVSNSKASHSVNRHLFWEYEQLAALQQLHTK